MSCKCLDKKPKFTSTTSFDDKYELSKCRCASRFTVSENKSKFRKIVVIKNKRFPNRKKE